MRLQTHYTQRNKVSDEIQTESAWTGYKHAHGFKPVSEILDQTQTWHHTKKIKARYKITKKCPRSCQQKLSVFIVTCSVLVWTGDNKHAEFLKPDSCVTTNALHTKQQSFLWNLHRWSMYECRIAPMVNVRMQECSSAWMTQILHTMFVSISVVDQQKSNAMLMSLSKDWIQQSLSQEQFFLAANQLPLLTLQYFELGLVICLCGRRDIVGYSPTQNICLLLYHLVALCQLLFKAAPQELLDERHDQSMICSHCYMAKCTTNALCVRL